MEFFTDISILINNAHSQLENNGLVTENNEILIFP